MFAAVVTEVDTAVIHAVVVAVAAVVGDDDVFAAVSVGVVSVVVGVGTDDGEEDHADQGSTLEAEVVVVFAVMMVVVVVPDELVGVVAADDEDAENGEAAVGFQLQGSVLDVVVVAIVGVVAVAVVVVVVPN